MKVYQILYDTEQPIELTDQFYNMYDTEEEALEEFENIKNDLTSRLSECVSFTMSMYLVDIDTKKTEIIKIYDSNK